MVSRENASQDRRRLCAVLLDAGGTLLQESPSRAAIYAEVARARGLAVDARTLRVCMHRAHAELPRVLDGHFRYSVPWFQAFIARVFHRELGLARHGLPGIEAELFERFADPSTFRLFPGALELCEGLRERGLRIGIVSNWSPALPEVLRGLGLHERVDFVLVSALEQAEKPEPEIFARALARAGTRADEALFCGNDLERDVRGAERSGLRAVLVDHPITRRDPSATAPGVVRVESLAELGRWVVERLE
jgi:putative hydrolase of the HAD superfamily